MSHISIFSFFEVAVCLFITNVMHLLGILLFYSATNIQHEVAQQTYTTVSRQTFKAVKLDFNRLQFVPLECKHVTFASHMLPVHYVSCCLQNDLKRR